MAIDAPRTFAVFCDESESVVVETKLDHPRPATTYSVPPPAGPVLVYASDKENVDPFTGSRVLSEHALGKKRKTTIVSKSQPVSSPSKKPRPLAEKPTKKPTLKTRSADTKSKRVTTSKRTTSIRTRREPSLPRLAEEIESADQAVIDSKCKDLTVLPLADISEAYEQAPAKEGALAETNKPAQDKLVADEVKVEQPTSPPPPTLKENVSSSPSVSVPLAFSTPERKRIYSAFTFSSPSPASKRLADAKSSSVERFSDVVF